jgi:hypothetical protein
METTKSGMTNEFWILQLEAISLDEVPYGLRYKMTFRQADSPDSYEIVKCLRFEHGSMSQKMKRWFSIMLGKDVSKLSHFDVNELIGKKYLTEVLLDMDKIARRMIRIYSRIM